MEIFKFYIGVETTNFKKQITFYFTINSGIERFKSRDEKITDESVYMFTRMTQCSNLTTYIYMLTKRLESSGKSSLVTSLYHVKSKFTELLFHNGF